MNNLWLITTYFPPHKKNGSRLLETAIAQPHDPILIAHFRQSWKSSAQPVLARGIDKCNYVVKGQQAGRQIVNDQIIARLRSNPS